MREYRKKMHNLIKAEIFKLIKLPAYKWLLASASFFVFILNQKEISEGNIYTGVEWLCMMLMRPNYMIWFSVFAALYVAEEFSNRTIYSSFLCGFSREKIFWSKSIIYFLGVLFLMLIYALTGMVFWSLNCGFGVILEIDTCVVVGKIIIYCFNSVIVFGGGYLLCAMLSRNVVATVGVGLGVSQVLGIIGGNIEFIQNPILKSVLGVIYRGTVYWQMSWDNEANPIWQLKELTGENVVWQAGQLRKTQPSMYIPLWFSIVTSLMAAVIMLAATIYIIKKQDLK